MKGRTFLRALRRGGGLLLLGAAYLPIHRLLAAERAGPAGTATVSIADAGLGVLQAGTALALLAGLALAALVPLHRVERALSRAAAWIRAPGAAAWGAGVFVVTLALSLATSLGVHRGLPRLLDEMVQLLHARVLTSGALALPMPEPAAVVLVQNSLLTPAGWVSIYPPGHTVLLAAGLLGGAVWAVGPLLLSVTTLFSFLAMDSLLPSAPVTTRVASLSIAGSPFLLLLGSGYLSHGSAAAAAAIAFWAAIKAWQEGPAWAVFAGAAFGFMVTSRPWIGLALGGSLVAGTWLCAWWREGRSPAWLAARLALGALGSAPFALGLLAYGHRVFGSPTRLGYDVAFGPAHGLGLHPDPWGNVYGLREAIGYTAADLSTLGLRLLETPLSAVGVVGAFLMLAPRLSLPTRFLLVWALVPVGANALYWHHGQHMGPRMLFESGPAWLALAAISAVGLIRGGVDPGLPEGANRPRGRSLFRGTMFWTFLIGIVGGVSTLAPSRIGGEGWSADGLARSTIPEIPSADPGPTVIVVHGTWANRVASRLVASGMRRDSVETALRQNDLCRVHLYAEARARRAAPLPLLDLVPRPGMPPDLRAVETPWGVRVRLDGNELPPECLRELGSDRYGVIELAPLLWQLPFPGTSDDLILARDLGPDGNRVIAEAYPDARPLVLGMSRLGEPPRLLPYDEAMSDLWGGAP